MYGLHIHKIFVTATTYCAFAVELKVSWSRTCNKTAITLPRRIMGALGEIKKKGPHGDDYRGKFGARWALEQGCIEEICFLWPQQGRESGVLLKAARFLVVLVPSTWTQCNLNHEFGSPYFFFFFFFLTARSEDTDLISMTICSRSSPWYWETRAATLEAFLGERSESSTPFLPCHCNYVGNHSMELCYSARKRAGVLLVGQAWRLSLSSRLFLVFPPAETRMNSAPRVPCTGRGSADPCVCRVLQA